MFLSNDFSEIHLFLRCDDSETGKFTFVVRDCPWRKKKKKDRSVSFFMMVMLWKHVFVLSHWITYCRSVRKREFPFSATTELLSIGWSPPGLQGILLRMHSPDVYPWVYTYQLFFFISFSVWQGSRIYQENHLSTSPSIFDIEVFARPLS